MDSQKKHKPDINFQRADSRTKRSGLFHRYFYVTTIIIFISLAILGSALLIFVAINWATEKTTLLSQNAKNVAQTSSKLVEKGYMENNDSYSAMLISSTIAQLSSAIDADIYICNDQGKIIYCKEIWQPDLLMYTGECIIHGKYTIPQVVFERAKSGGFSGTGNLGGVYSTSHFISVEPIVASGKTVGLVIAAQETTSLKEPVLAILKMFLFSALLALAISFVATYVLTYQMTKPLREMSAAAKQYSNGDFSHRISVPHQKKLLGSDEDEVEELVTAFNAMANALSAIETSRRNFVANVSHELKTPMTTIGGFIDGILDGTIDQSKSQYYLRIVSDEVKRLSRLVTGMLNMSKIEAGQLDLKPKKFDISAMIFKTLLGFERVIEEKSIEIRGLDRIESMNIYADEDMINQVIYNLIDNAVKFTEKGGYIEVMLKADSEKAIVSIKNSGKGIAKEEVGIVFERFYKTDKSRSYDVKGAGLGLYIVKTIIDMHGGQISVQSEENEYTQFVFWLPIK